MREILVTKKSQGIKGTELETDNELEKADFQPGCLQAASEAPKGHIPDIVLRHEVTTLR